MRGLVDVGSVGVSGCDKFSHNFEIEHASGCAPISDGTSLPTQQVAGSIPTHSEVHTQAALYTNCNEPAGVGTRAFSHTNEQPRGGTDTTQNRVTGYWER
jgi:hypothetical protein